MNLLLLLSALLSAITGIGSARGETVPASAVCACASATQPAKGVVRSVAHRPIAFVATIARVASPPLAVLPMLVAAEPIFASRRRE